MNGYNCYGVLRQKGSPISGMEDDCFEREVVC